MSRSRGRGRTPLGALQRDGRIDELTAHGHQYQTANQTGSGGKPRAIQLVRQIVKSPPSSYFPPLGTGSSTAPLSTDGIVVQHCHAVNSTFDAALGGPLPFSKESATASSISRWVRRNFKLSKSEWHADQSRRAAERRERAAALRADGATYKAIAYDLGCSTGTVCRPLHEHREREGIPQPGRGRRNTTVPMPRKTT